jgi:DNA invertase Pin-like site-specific DNA recombinase
MTATVRQVAVYARVSLEQQNCGSQLHEIREYLAGRGLTGTEYVDHGHSGAKRSRPALDTMLQSLRRRKHSVLVCWSLDRLSRSAAHAAALIDELHQLDVTIIALKQGIDTSTPMGRAFAQMAGIFAELERQAIIERVRAGLARRKAAGTPWAGPGRQSSPMTWRARAT